MTVDFAGIYMIKNIVNGKVYIGSSTNIRKRWNQHRCYLEGNKHHCKALQNSYNKHGKINFEYILVETCESSILEIREQFWIDKYWGKTTCYNAFRTAYSVSGENHPMFGNTHSPESRAKIKEARSRQIISHSPETRKKIGRPGKKMPIEHINKMVAARNGKAWNKGLKTGIEPASKIKIDPAPIIAQYNSGDSVEKIRKEMKLSWDVIIRILKDNNIPTRTHKEQINLNHAKKSSL